MDKTTEILKQKLENMSREELDEKLSKYKHLHNTLPSAEEYLELVDEIQRRNETNQHIAKTRGCGE